MVRQNFFNRLRAVLHWIVISFNVGCLIGSVAVLIVSRQEHSKTSSVLRGFLAWMSLATAARIFQLQYDRHYPRLLYTEWGTLIERPINSPLGQLSSFIDRNLSTFSLLSSIFVFLLLDKGTAADALKHSKLLYLASMSWIGLHFAYILGATLFIPTLVLCLPCIVIGLRWFFRIEFTDILANGNRNRNRNAPATEEVLQHIWHTKYATNNNGNAKDDDSDNTYTNPDNPLQQLKIPKEDTKCSICLGWYEAGDELRILPCLHHFHQECADHWLKITATCPLCVRPIVEGGGGERNV